MTKWGCDQSNHQWGNGPPPFADIRADGIDFYVHKVSEGLHYYRDPYSGRAQMAADAGFAVVGGYHVLHGNADPVAQADWYVACLDVDNSDWRTMPCFRSSSLGMYILSRVLRTIL